LLGITRNDDVVYNGLRHLKSRDVDHFFVHLQHGQVDCHFFGTFIMSNPSGEGEPTTVWSQIKEQLDDIQSEVKAISQRVRFLEENQVCATPVGGSTWFGHAPVSSDTSVDVGAQYTSVRNAVQSVKIPQELCLPETSRTGIKRQDQALLSVVSKCGKFCETAFKVLKKGSEDNADETFADVFTVLHAMIAYLQEEQASMVVQSTFDPTVSRFFRSLQRGSSFTPQALDNLRSAASIAAAYRPQRGRGAQGGSQFGRGGQRGRDTFFSQSTRGFPQRQRQDRSEFNQDSNSSQ
jgi:virulence-associated protein VagC